MECWGKVLTETSTELIVDLPLDVLGVGPSKLLRHWEGKARNPHHLSHCKPQCGRKTKICIQWCGTEVVIRK